MVCVITEGSGRIQSSFNESHYDKQANTECCVSSLTALLCFVVNINLHAIHKSVDIGAQRK